MENNSAHDKTRLANYIAIWLKNQLDFWRSKGILSEEQKENISNLYEWPKEETTRLKKSPLKLITAIETIGALLIGIGVISLIAFNWPKMPNFHKLIIIVFIIVLTHLTGFFILRSRLQLQKAGLSLIFLANLFYGAGIWLVAQAYHIHSNFATGIFLWALGIVPFVYVIKSRLNYFFALALFILWTISESVSYQKPHFAFLFVLLGLLIPLAYHLSSKTGLVISLITAALWLLINNVFWFGENFSLILFLPFFLYGTLLITSSSLHLLNKNYQRFRSLYLYAAIVILGIAFFLLPFFGVFQRFYKPAPYTSLSIYFWLFNLILLLGILISVSLSAKVTEDKTAVLIKQMLPAFLSSSLLIICLPYLKTSLLSNLLPMLFIVFSYWYHRQSRLLINLALIYFFIWLPFCLTSWKQPFMFFEVLLLYGTFCYILGWVYVARFADSLSGNLFKVLGLLGTFFAVYIFSFDSVAVYFSRHYVFPKDWEFWYVVVSLYAALILLYERYLSSFNYPLAGKGRLVEERVLTLILPALPIIFFILVSSKLTGFWYTFFVNFSFIGLLVTFLAAGYRRQELHLKIISFVFLILLVGTRYLEMEWSLLYKAALFIVTGITVLVIGIAFEKNKDKVVIIEK